MCTLFLAVLFIGVVVHPLSMVTEYCSRGNLFDLLHNESIPLLWPLRKRMALDAAKGMSCKCCFLLGVIFLLVVALCILGNVLHVACRVLQIRVWCTVAVRWWLFAPVFHSIALCTVVIGCSGIVMFDVWFMILCSVMR